MENLLDINEMSQDAQKSGVGDGDGANDSETIINALKKATTSDDMDAMKYALELAMRNGLADDEQVQAAQEAMESLEERELLWVQLKVAMEAMNSDAIGDTMDALLTSSPNLESNPLVEHAKSLEAAIIKTNQERERRIGLLEEALMIAIEEENLKELKALRLQAYELQYSGEKCFDPMNKKIKELEERAELFDEVERASRTLQIKMRSPDGIMVDDSEKFNDLDPLSLAIKACVPKFRNEKEIKAAEKLLEKAEKQHEAQFFIAKALKQYLDFDGKEEHNPAFDKLEEALKLVQELGLVTRDADTVVREYLKLEILKARIDMDNKKQRRKERLTALSIPDKDQRKGHVMRRLKHLYKGDFDRAIKDAGSNEEYALRKYYRIRAGEDFAQFIDGADEKEKAMKDMLVSQKSPLKISMLEIDDIQNTIAIEVNRSILEYCGDLGVQRNFESRANYIIQQGMVDETLADEIFVQLCKHIAGNTDDESTDWAWRLMCQCTTFFPSSSMFEPYLLYFLKSYENFRGIPGHCAKFALAQLSCSRLVDHQNYLPTHEELSAYLQRPPVLAEIERCDGMIMTLPLLPDMRLKMALEMIRKLTGMKIALKKPEWGIYVEARPQTKSVCFRERTYNFFRKHNTSKLYKVEIWVEFWKNNQDDFFKQLTASSPNGYGAEPSLRSTTVATRKKLKRKTVLQSGKSKRDVNGESTRSLPPENGSSRKNSSESNRENSDQVNREESNEASKETVHEEYEAARESVSGVHDIDLNEMVEELSPKIAWPLPWWAYLGEFVGALYRQDHVPTFTFKRRIMRKKDRVDDFVYEQLLREWQQGYLPLDEPGLTPNLAVTALAVRRLETGNDITGLDEDAFQTEGLLQFIPTNVRNQKEPSEWYSEASKIDLSKFESNIEKLKQHFFEEVQNSEKFGMSFFAGNVCKGHLGGKKRNAPGTNGTIDDDYTYTIGISPESIIFQQQNKTHYSIPFSAVKRGATRDKKMGGVFLLICDKSQIRSHLENDDQQSSASNPGTQLKVTGKKGRAVKSGAIELLTLQPKEMYDLTWLFLHTKTIQKAQMD